jgi:hypothetical protein
MMPSGYRRIETIGDNIPPTAKSVVGFINVEDAKDIITALRRNLDSAAQLLQVRFESPVYPH